MCIRDSISATICQGDTYAFNGQNLATAGLYLDTLMQTNGCDSIIRLDLMVTSTPDLSTTNDEICIGENVDLATLITDNNSTAGSPTFHSAYPTNAGNQLTSSTVFPTTTTEYYIFKGGTTCNDVDSLTITVNPIDTTEVNETICENETYTFNSQNLNSAGIYLDTLTASTSCDSIIRLTLSVNPIDTTDITATICENNTYSFNGANLNMAGTYLDTLTASTTCDSIIRLNLTVNPVDTTDIAASICQGETYTFNGQNLTTAGMYLDTLAQTLSLIHISEPTRR